MTEIDPSVKSSRLVRGYNRLAPWYQTIESLRFGGGLQHFRVALLEQIPRCREALFLGDGDGRLLQAFVAKQSRCRVTSVDISDRMLALQQQRLNPIEGHEDIQFIQADIRDWVPPQRYDLIVSAYHLDCFTADDVRQIIERLSGHLREGGCWYVVDFAVPQRGWRRRWAQGWSALMIAFFRWQTGLQTRQIVDLREIFFQLGWTAIAQRESRSEFQFAVLMRR